MGPPHDAVAQKVKPKGTLSAVLIVGCERGEDVIPVVVSDHSIGRTPAFAGCSQKNIVNSATSAMSA